MVLCEKNISAHTLDKSMNNFTHFYSTQHGLNVCTYTILYKEKPKK